MGWKLPILYKVLNAIIANANNCGTHGFVKNNTFFNEGLNFFRINLLQIKVGLFSLFQCEIKLIRQTVHFYNPFNSSLARVPIIVEGT